MLKHSCKKINWIDQKYTTTLFSRQMFIEQNYLSSNFCHLHTKYTNCRSRAHQQIAEAYLFFQSKYFLTIGN